MPDPLSREPETFIAGDTVQWSRTDLADFPASAWTLTYYINGAPGGQISQVATADGDNFSITLAAATTADLPPGRYQWTAVATSGAERFTVDSGEFVVKADPTTVPAGFDGRSDARRILDAINATIEKRASKDADSYSIEGRTISRTPIADLLRLRDKYAAIVAAEVRADRIAKGLGHAGKILVRFP